MEYDCICSTTTFDWACDVSTINGNKSEAVYFKTGFM
jgi:hypothetical protein